MPIITAGFIAAGIATASFAAGGGDGAAPKQTKTTKECKKGKVWDKKKKKCINAKHGMFSDDFIYENARELAYNDQFEHAIKLLNLAANPLDPRILNYLGFTNRKAGRTALAMKYYRQALTINPDYILARSYMGQALVLEGDIDGAWAQLAEIADRGGKESWSYVALKRSIAGKISY
ncbi:MAG: tetratricopeptide repeat protein [Rhodobacteraceae bacterium]|nr:tetratricopeptide repeat protein [Paracoccaceae bacterium]